MLKTLSTELAKPRKGGVEVGSCSRAGRDRNKVDGDEVGDDKVEKKVQKRSKSKNLSKSKKTVGSSDFLTFETKLAFTK